MTVYTKTMMDALAEVRGIQTEASIKPAQIAQLKKAYEPMRDKKISVGNANKLSALMDKFAKNKDVLIQLAKADIPFVSSAAVTRLISKHGMKGAEINKLKKEEMEFWAELDEAKNYEIKNGKIHISKANFRKVHKDFKNSTKGKERMMALDPKSGATTSYEVVFEEVELDEGVSKYKKFSDLLLKKSRLVDKHGPRSKEVKAVDKEIKAEMKKLGIDEPTLKQKERTAARKRANFEEVELEEGRMKELHGYIAQGKSAEWIGKKMGVDAKTVKTLMDAIQLKLDEASARADAMRAMRRDKKVDPADVDDTATDADVKAASKNILVQMRKVASLAGNKVEFLDKKKVKVEPNIANAFIKKYEGMRRPADKEKFQKQAMKSYKEMLKVLKAGYYEEVVKEETILERIDRKLKERKNG